MIGDRIHDFEAAAELGLTSIGVTWGYGNDEERAVATRCVSSPDELYALLVGDKPIVPRP
jgi:phosphoglycolate phosphatase-like HAD superfamily hydrolase